MTGTQGKLVFAMVTALVIGGGSLSASSAMAKSENGAQQRRAPIVEVDHRGPRHGDERMHRHRDGRKMHGPGRGYFLSKHQVRRTLRYQGYRDIRFLGQRGSIYIVHADGWRGRPQRLTVDGRSGFVLHRQPIHGAQFQWGYRW